MMTTRRFIFGILTGLLVFSLGCSDDDDPTNPGVPLPEDDPAVELIQAESTEMARALLEALPDLASGAVGTKTIDEAYYDETCMCWWWWNYEGNENTTPYWSRNAYFSAAFFAGETPQQNFEGADRIVVSLEFLYDWSTFTQTTYTNRSIVFNMTLEATGWNTKAMTVTGSGNGHASGGTGNYDDEEWDGFFEEFDVDVSLGLAPQGCPTGSIDLSTEEAGFDMDFDGTSTGSWAYTVGSIEAGSGTFPLGCGEL